METLQLETTIGPDGVLRIEAPTRLTPGPAQVVVVVSPVAERMVDCIDLRGVGKEIWEGIDAQEYVNGLRDEWER